MYDTYENPLVRRYAGREMAALFSDDTKFRTWRRLWIALAEAEKDLGLGITDEQLAEMKAFADDINYDVAVKKEKECRHDVMAHIHAYGKQCKKAMPIIHLGATSCYVGDNTDIILMRDALKLIKKKLVNCMDALSRFSLQYKDMPTLGFTHFQPAQLTTVGKRACLWLQDLLMDYGELEHAVSGLKLLGVKGTTGTQASFLELFDGDHEKVKALDEAVAKKMGFAHTFPVTGQTYPRKLDNTVLNVLSGIAQSAYKFSNDMRLLQSMKEIEEPFEKGQVGSSAMAYKRNPMRSERISSLSRYVLSLAFNTGITAGTQWFERTLDDSANRRITIPQAFLAVDAILIIYHNITSNLVVYPKVIDARIQSELPFMATENILMDAVKKGGDRQALHEKIRRYSMEAAHRVKAEGLDNNLIELIAKDPAFGMSREEILATLAPVHYTGRAPQQTEEFNKDHIQPVLHKESALLGMKEDVSI